jgi:predicted small lipoprotein YifL
MRPSLLAFSLISIVMLAGCGTKGPLTLPPGPDKPPLFGHPAPAPATANPTTAATPPKPVNPVPARDDSNSGAKAP